MLIVGDLRLKPNRSANRSAARSVLPALGLCLALGAPAPGAAKPAVHARPVVVELFTAQGCAACPQANQMLAGLADEDGVIALTFAVDYWDYLGWRDTFAMPEFTSRQRAYVAKLKLKDLYTPDVVVGGRDESPGADPDKIKSLIEAQGATRARLPTLGFFHHGERFAVGRGQAPPHGAELWLVRYDPTRRDVKVKAGENAGKTVTQVNVVRELVRLGPWTGRPRAYDVPPADPARPGLKAVVLLQATGGGPILAAVQN